MIIIYRVSFSHELRIKANVKILIRLLSRFGFQNWYEAARGRSRDQRAANNDWITFRKILYSGSDFCGHKFKGIRILAAVGAAGCPRANDRHI